MNAKRKLTIIVLLTFICLLNSTAQINSGTITMTQTDWECSDWYGDECYEEVKNYTLNVTPNTPIKINIQTFTYDYINISTSERNYYYTQDPTIGVQSVTVISPTGTIYIYANNSWNGMAINPVFSLNYDIDPSYTVTTNPSIIQNDQYISGKLGIGIPASEKLEVQGSARINNKLTVGYPAMASSANLAVYGYNNSSATYGIYNYLSKSTSSSVFGVRSEATNNSGNVYGIYSSVSGQTGKKWAGYFDGGNVAVMNGNVGIGTSTPKALLDVTGVGNWAGGLAVISKNVDPYYGDCLVPFKNSKKMLLGWNYSSGRGEQSFFSNGPANLIGGFSFYNYRDDASTASHLMTIGGDGNVGIGIATASEKLEVVGTAIANKIVSRGEIISSVNNLDIGGTLVLENTAKITNGQAKQWRIYNMGGSYGNSLQFWAYDNIGCVSGGMCLPRFTIMDNGKVGIGTQNPDELLTVNGIIHAKEVRVDLTGSLADYVFSPDYSLMPLPKVEAFVKQNKHLPEIPSAAEVKEKGLSMGEMQNKLLQKIEELTLYVIELQKTNEKQTAEIEALKRK